MWHNKKKNPFAIPSADPTPMDRPVSDEQMLQIPKMQVPSLKDPANPRPPRFARLKGLLK
jgi:hypothetical protein